MRYHRKLTLFVLVAAMTLLAVNAPKITSAQSDTVTLNFVYGAFAPQSQWEAYFKDFLSAHPNIRINYIPVSLDNGWAGYTDKIVTLIAGGQSIDVIWTAIESVPMLAEKGVLSPLDGQLTKDASSIKEYLDDVDPTLFNGLKWKDHQYLLPFAWNNEVIWYNPKLFKDAGLKEPADGWTWQEFLADAHALTHTNSDGQIDRYGFVVDPSWFGTAPWYITNGTNVLTPDFAGPNFDDPKVADTLQWLHDLVWKEKVAPSDTKFPMYEYFAAGNLAMFSGGRWPLESLKPMGTTDFQIAPWPKNVKSGTVFGTDGYGVTVNAQHPDEAWQLVKELISTKVMSHLVGLTGASGSIPARRSLALGKDIATLPPTNFHFWYDSLAYAQKVSNPPNYPDLTRIYDRYVSLIMSNEMSVQEAVGHMQDEMKVTFK